MIITVIFTANDGKTIQIITVHIYTDEDRDIIVDMGETLGMDSSLDRMEDYLTEIQYRLSKQATKMA